MTEDINPFDKAKAIADLLKDLGKDQQEKVLRWVAESLGLERTMHSFVALGQSETTQQGGGIQQAGRAMDIKTFTELKQPKSDIQFAAVVAYYYQFEAAPHERKSGITADLLKEATRLVGRNRMPDPTSTLNNAKKQGYLDSVSKGTFAVNSVGENLVAMALPGGGGGASRARGKKK